MTDSGSYAQPQVAGPFSIGSDCWPGLAKLAEECGELVQVLGKLIATNGEIAHWDGSDLRLRVQEELADVLAAARFFVARNALDRSAVGHRASEKEALFWGWDDEARHDR